MRLFLIHCVSCCHRLSPSVFGAPRPQDMVLVPAGEFTMGTSADSDGLPDEQPLRLVYSVRSGSIGRSHEHPLSNSTYKTTGYQAPANASPASTLWEHNRRCPASNSIPW